MDATRITRKRNERNMSVTEFATRLGVAKTTVYRWESGYIEKISVDRLIQIAQVLETSPSYLMGWGDEDETEEDSSKECFTVPQKLSPDDRSKVEAYIQDLLKRH